MIKKIILIMFLTVVGCLEAWGAPNPASSEEGKSEWRLNVKRVAVDLSSTSVSNARDYENSPVSALSADGETVVKGTVDMVLEHEHDAYRWDNRLYMEYGKTTLKPASGPKSSSESADEILLTSDYAHKIWKYEETDVGPFAQIGYQTEFTANDDAPRQKILRAMGGLKMFNGKYIKNLYIAPVIEEDLTYSKGNEKLAWEIGGNFEYPLREGVKFVLGGYYRDFFSYSRYQGTDFRYDLKVDGRMDVKLNDHLSLAPVISYRRAQSREADVAGSNLMVGVSLSYSGLYDL